MIKTARGFSLVELMVVVGIIVVLLGIILASIMDARSDSRDKRRVSDVSNIALAMTLYKEKNRSYPVAPSGIEIGKGGTLDGPIQQLGGNTYADPLETGTYGYWYYSDVLCNGKLVNAIVAKTMEKGSNSNYEEVCGVNGLAQSPESTESTLIPRAYADHCPYVGGDGRTDQGVWVGDSTTYCHTTLVCSMQLGTDVVAYTTNPISIDKPTVSPKSLYMRWASGAGSVTVKGPPSGTTYAQDWNNSSPHSVSISPSWPAGTYEVYMSNFPSCKNTFTLVAYTQCNDNSDNDRDALVDSADPGCHTGGDITAPYDATINSEINLAFTQCNDSTDNDSDGLTDSSDPGCHIGDVLTGAYDATITSEDNTIAPPPAPSGTVLAGSYIIILK